MATSPTPAGGGMFSQIVPFTFESRAVRVVVDERGEPWFIAADVCGALEIANSRDAVTRLDPDERNTVAIADGNRGNPSTTVVSEPGVYRLVFTSRADGAERFKRWLAHEVLPSIRKTGTYSSAREVPRTFSQALRLAAEQAEKIEAQERQIAAQQPAVEFVGRYVEAKSTKCIRDVAKVLGLRERAFIAHLEADGVLFRQSGQLRPAAEYQHCGYFEVRTGEAHGHAYVHTRFTPAGIAWAAQRYAMSTEAPPSGADQVLSAGGVD